MPLPSPNLDDRRFQDIVDEAKRRIPLYAPEWTDHNVSDPGVTLIELFAWMVEMLLYRVNRVPEKAYITFMELMGVRLLPPAAARAPLTFWLSAPTSEPVTIPAGTEVATVQTSADNAVVFSTDAPLVVRPPSLVSCLTSPDEQGFEDQTRDLGHEGESFLAFSPSPRPGNAFYIGDAGDLSGHILTLTISCSIEGIGVDPRNPPLAWEAWCSDGWLEAEVERDETGGLNKNGQVVLYLPQRMARRELGGKEAFWVRCRHVSPRRGQPTYSASPKIHALSVETTGITGSATHSVTIAGESLGQSSGLPGQHFQLEFAPVLPRRPGEALEVFDDQRSAWEPWTEREHFGDSLPGDTHFTLDSVSGLVSFGPSIREPDGSTRQYGAVPPRGSQIRFSRYRSGGGAIGNVGSGTVSVLRSSVPYVDRVSNRRPAVGGRDAESLERAKLRAPQMLRTSSRAVTAEDYEYLAREASQSVARARCIQPRAVGADGPAPGAVKVLLVPAASPAEGRLTQAQLNLPPELIQEVQQYLDERRLLTSVLVIGQPEYRFVAVEARVKARVEADPQTVSDEAARRLYRFLNPLVGGADGNGWTFGRDLYVSEVFAVLQGTPGVEYIEQVTMTVEGQPGNQTRVSVPDDGLVGSAEHRIIVV